MVVARRPGTRREASSAAANEPEATLERSAPVAVLDLCGTFAFALGGAMAGIRRGLEGFGVLVLSFAASNFGGIMREVLIGATPPAALVHWRDLAVSLVAALIAVWSGIFAVVAFGRLFGPVGIIFGVPPALVVQTLVSMLCRRDVLHDPTASVPGERQMPRPRAADPR